MRQTGHFEERHMCSTHITMLISHDTSSLGQSQQLNCQVRNESNNGNPVKFTPEAEPPEDEDR